MRTPTLNGVGKTISVEEEQIADQLEPCQQLTYWPQQPEIKTATNRLKLLNDCM